MEALSILKFWKTTTSSSKVACGTTISTIGGDDDTSSISTTTSSTIPDQTKQVKQSIDNISEFSDYDDKEEDSFFELELTLPDYNSQFQNNPVNFAKTDSELRRNSYDSDIDSVNWAPINSLLEESCSKPQSPISRLRCSANPKLRVLMFGKFRKSKSEVATDETESIFSNNSSCTTAPKQANKATKQQLPQQKRKVFTVRLKMDTTNKKSSIIPKKFTRSNSARISTSSTSSSSSSGSSPRRTQNRQCVDFDGGLSRRFSKDSMQKYLSLLKKPLNGKSPRKSDDSYEIVKVVDLFSGSELTASPSSFPSPSSMCSPKNVRNNGNKESKRFSRVVCKHLGKSKSASATVVNGGGSGSSPVTRHMFMRRNEEGDGIEGAIQHCKRSLNSTACKEKSLLSRCTSDPSSYEKSIQLKINK